MQPLIGSDQMTRATLVCVRSAQRRWNGTSVSSRLKILRSLRHDIARNARDLAAAVPLHRESQLSRTVADTLCSEVFPLAEACRFLEREAVGLLRPVRQPSRLRPIWLSGVDVETQREPLGIVLIIGPGNYPLFIPGVQALQALVAGNAVLWKPAPGCSSPALKLQSMLTAAGLERDLFTVLDESQETAQRFIAAGVDKVILTGSAETGRAIMHSLAENLTPSVMELSGCDAVFVLKEADPARVVDALVFGLRFNGSATCMAPRRLILSRSIGAQLVPRLTEALRHVAPVAVTVGPWTNSSRRPLSLVPRHC
jgi:acyl-CoA reductase-like NAD-dependent aldehyde dehydrogenase